MWNTHQELLRLFITKYTRGENSSGLLTEFLNIRFLAHKEKKFELLTLKELCK